jgi:hypothetical protein
MNVKRSQQDGRVLRMLWGEGNGGCEQQLERGVTKYLGEQEQQ